MMAATARFTAIHAAMNRHATVKLRATHVAAGACAPSMRRHGLGGIAAPRPLH
jgi:hypothetical protein